MTKSESRYFNTALLMNEALILLLEKKDWEFITVTEICKKAGVNRSTFYLHYETMDDLLYETIEMIGRRFNEAFSNEKLDIQGKDKKGLFFVDDQHLIPYLNFIKENKRVYKLIHKKPHIFKKQYTSQEWYEQLFYKILDKYGVAEDEKEYVFAYFCFGLVALVQKWIEKDCTDSVENIARLMKKVVGYEV